jgi:hypothetical protein
VKRLLLLLLLISPCILKAQVYSDTFSGSAGPVSTNWTMLYGLTCVKDGSSNVWGNGSNCAMYYNAGTFSNTNLYSQIKITATASSTFGPCLTTPGTGSTCWLINANVLYDVDTSGGGLGGLGSCPTVSVGDIVRIALTSGSYYCINETTGQSSHYPPLNFSTASLPSMQLNASAKATNWSAGPADTSFSLSPTTIITGTTGNVISLLGVNTQWSTLSATFSLSGGTGASITAQSVTDNTHASITVTAGSADAILTVTDNSTFNTQTIYAHTNVTLYIANDGGTASQCSGKVNHAYPPATGTDCRLASIQWLLCAGGTLGWCNFYGGDTVQYVLDNSSNPPLDYIGQQGTSGRGIDMAGSGFTYCVANNFNCYLPPVPSGPPSHNTKIYGPCVPSCLNSSGTNVVNNVATLSGVNGVFWILNLHGSANVDIEGLFITQPTQCVINAYPTPVAGKCASGDDYASRGISLAEDPANIGPTNFTIKQIAIRGIANEGIHGSSWNQADHSATSNITQSFIQGNGFTGFDPDNGNCHSTPIPCEGFGTLNFTYNYVDLNGCVTRTATTYNVTTGLPSDVNYCYSQSTGGQGDGVVSIPLGAGAVENFFNNHVRYNTQDGFDFLHDEDPTGAVTINLWNNWSEGNMGQAYKLRGGNTSWYAYNNVGIANGLTMVSPYSASNPYFSTFPSGWNNGLPSGDGCRAGDSVAFVYGPAFAWVHNTTIGYCSTTFDFQKSGSNTTTIALFQDNISMGFVNPSSSSLPSGISFVSGGNIFASVGTINYNNWFGMISGCPQVSPQETNYQCGDPLFQSESSIDTMIPTLTASSPGKYAGITPVSGLTYDYYGATWHSPPSMGAIEVVAATVKKLLRKVHH